MVGKDTRQNSDQCSSKCGLWISLASELLAIKNVDSWSLLQS